MAAHRYIDRICCVILALSLAVTVFFMNAERFGIKAESPESGYENRLFNTSSVHTVNIVMDDWKEFLSTCTDEEYEQCTVVIDNETYRNVAIRAKGNTSLTQVENYGNDRYSFKIEFDRYDSSETYYGLDKLCLNNLIQDNTYMKDYLTYQMMNAFGVDAPLCSYVYLTVNGEDWGLYLAVEGIEEAFLERNYGNDYGELYKPDSQSMGGGRGNGENFDMEEWSDKSGDSIAGEAPQNNSSENNKNVTNDADDISGADTEQTESSGSDTRGAPGAGRAEDSRTPGGMTPPGGNTAPENMQESDMQKMGAGGSSDVSLIYSDDSYESYSNIFDNAKTEITDADKDRLIASLKQLNENSSIEEVVNVEEVIRYFVVHNFVCNFDSYTGSMIHNYYLYEKDGQLSMIPWDYNLAFGGFVGGADATELVNYPIDTPVSGGSVESRPMLSWIFADEEYTELYHQYFADFISEYFDSGYFKEMTDSVKEMIAPYVEKDPTAFCTYEEFETGADTLQQFCLLRAESVKAQLNGTIASVSGEQSEDTLVDASGISIAAMGSMNNNRKDGSDFGTDSMRNQEGKESSDQYPDTKADAEGEIPTDREIPPEIPEGMNSGQQESAIPAAGDNAADGRPSEDSVQGKAAFRSGMQNDSNLKSGQQDTLSLQSYLLAGFSVIVLAAGLLTVFLYRKRV